MKIKFDRFCLIDFSILSVNCSYLCIIYIKIYEKILSGGLEVSFSIYQTGNVTRFDSTLPLVPYTLSSSHVRQCSRVCSYNMYLNMWSIPHV